MKTYLNTPQVAKLFGVNIQTVRAYIRSGELPAAKVGRRYVVSGDDIDTFVQARKESRKVEDAGNAKGAKKEPAGKGRSEK